MKKALLILSLFSLAVFSNAAMLQAYDPINRVNKDVVCFPNGVLMAATGNTTTGVADMGDSSCAAYLKASPSGQPYDPVSASVSATASLFISITITSTVNGTQNHQILAAPGAGLRYRIKTYGMGVSGACTGGNTTALISLCSNGVTLQDTVYTPLLPTSVPAGPGGYTVPEVDKTHTFLVGGYNEPLCWKWITTAPMAGTSCIARLNLEYEIIR